MNLQMVGRGRDGRGDGPPMDPYQRPACPYQSSHMPVKAGTGGVFQMEKLRLRPEE